MRFATNDLVLASKKFPAIECLDVIALWKTDTSDSFVVTVTPNKCKSEDGAKFTKLVLAFCNRATWLQLHGIPITYESAVEYFARHTKSQDIDTPTSLAICTTVFILETFNLMPSNEHNGVLFHCDDGERPPCFRPRTDLN